MTSSEFSTALKQTRALMPKALRADRSRARRRIEHLLKPGDKTPGDRDVRLLAEVTARLEKSVAVKSTRFSSFPSAPINPVLPIAARQADIIAALFQAHPVVIVSGATGSGKTTQIPKMCVAAGLGRDGRIGCTQPRRIAAMTIARRISDEIGATGSVKPPRFPKCAWRRSGRGRIGCTQPRRIAPYHRPHSERDVGTAVGYKIRFSDRTADKHPDQNHDRRHSADRGPS